MASLCYVRRKVGHRALLKMPEIRGASYFRDMPIARCSP